MYLLVITMIIHKCFLLSANDHLPLRSLQILLYPYIIWAFRRGGGHIYPVLQRCTAMRLCKRASSFCLGRRAVGLSATMIFGLARITIPPSNDRSRRNLLLARARTLAKNHFRFHP
jgi:hypothetical protein